MSKNLSPAAFLALVNKGARTDADIMSASTYLKRSAYQRALWLDVRVATDGVDNGTAAEEAGVSAGRVSQIRYGVTAMVRAGIPTPGTVDAATVAESTYLHVSRVYKSGKAGRERLKAAVKRAEAIADIAGKHSALLAVVPTGDDEKETRAARVNDGTTTSSEDDTNNTGAPATAHTVTEAPSTIAERLAALVADVKNDAPIADIDAAMALADALSDAIATRAGLTVDA